MKVCSLYSIVFLLSILTSPILSAQLVWERVDQTGEGPINRVGSIRSIVFAPDGAPVVVAGDGIYRVEEREIGDVPPRVGIYVDSNVTVGTVRSWSDALYAVTQQALYRSDDSGRTWREQFRPQGSPLGYHDLVEAGGMIIVPDRSGNRLTVIDEDGSPVNVYSIPAGWHKIASTPSGSLILLHPAGSKKILTSDDLGASWQPVETEGIDPNLAPTDLFVLSDSIFAVRSGVDLYFSENGGRSWHPSGVIPDEYVHSLFLSNDGTLWGVHNNLSRSWEGARLSSSTDGGRTWQVGCTTLPSTHSFVDPEGRIYSQMSGELVVRANCNAPWHRFLYGFRNVTVASIASFDETFYATLAKVPDVGPEWVSRPYDLYRSDDAGLTWRWVAESDSREVMIDRTGNLYVQVDSVAHPTDAQPYRTVWSNILRSTDGGETWRAVFSSPLDGGWGIPFTSGIRSQNGGKVLLGLTRNYGSNGLALRLFSSTDGGESFTELDGLADTASFRAYGFELHPDGTALAAGLRYENGIYIGNHIIQYPSVTDEQREFETPMISSISMNPSGRLYGWNYASAHYSDDAGETWQDIPLPSQSPFATTLEEKGGRLWLLSSRKLFVTDDLGMTWEETVRTTPWDINETASYEEHIPAIVLDDGTIYDSVHVDRIDPYFGSFSLYHTFSFARSTDGGRSWDYPVDETLDRKTITAVARSSDGTVVVGTDHFGLYRAPAPSDVRDPIRIAPEDMYLALYPNPIGGSGRAEFYLRREGPTTLILYDLLGRRVQTIYDGPGYPGFYPISIDLSTLPVGPYILQLQQGNKGSTLLVQKN